MLASNFFKSSINYIKENYNIVLPIIIIKLLITLPFGWLPEETGRIVGTILTLLLDLYFFGFLAIQITTKKSFNESFSEALYGFFPLFSASLLYSLMTLLALPTVVGGAYIAARFIFLPIIALLENPSEGRFKRATSLSKNHMWLGVFLFIVNFALGLVSALLFDGMGELLFLPLELLFIIVDLVFDLFLIHFYLNSARELSNAS